MDETRDKERVILSLHELGSDDEAKVLLCFVSMSLKWEGWDWG